LRLAKPAYAFRYGGLKPRTFAIDSNISFILGRFIAECHFDYTIFIQYSNFDSLKPVAPSVVSQYVITQPQLSNNSIKPVFVI